MNCEGAIHSNIMCGIIWHSRSEQGIAISELSLSPHGQRLWGIKDDDRIAICKLCVELFSRKKVTSATSQEASVATSAVANEVTASNVPALPAWGKSASRKSASLASFKSALGKVASQKKASGMATVGTASATKQHQLVQE